MSQRTTIAVLFYMVLALVLRFTYGTYHPILLIVLVITFGLFVSLAVLRRKVEESIDAKTSPGLILSMVFLAFSVMLWFDPLIISAQGTDATFKVRLFLTIQLLTAMVLLVTQWFKRPIPLIVWTVFAIAWAVVPMIRYQTLQAAPNPGIDVFVTNTLASDYFLSGDNPYEGKYPDLYEGKYDYQPGFFYWPAYLYWAAPFRAVLGDIRWAMVVADLITAAALVLIGRKLNFCATTTALLPLVWLSHPVSLLVLELAWIDPLLIAGIAALLACMLSRRWLAVGLLMGVVAGTKQYGTLVSLVTLVYVFAHHRPQSRRVLLSSAISWLALMLPYLWLDSRAMFDHSVAVYIGAAIRPDGLSIVAYLHNALGMTLPGLLLLVVYLSVVAGGCWSLYRREQAGLAGWSGILAAALGTIFLFGKQAFCNYYFVVAFFVLAFAILSMADDLAVMRRDRKPLGETSH